MWEAPVGPNRMSVGLDVHARSVVACGLDGQTGELFERRLTPDHAEIIGWVRSLPGPAAVTYEAGPTGFGLARAGQALQHLIEEDAITLSAHAGAEARTAGEAR